MIVATECRFVGGRSPRLDVFYARATLLLLMMAAWGPLMQFDTFSLSGSSLIGVECSLTEKLIKDGHFACVTTCAPG